MWSTGSANQSRIITYLMYNVEFIETSVSEHSIVLLCTPVSLDSNHLRTAQLCHACSSDGGHAET